MLRTSVIGSDFVDNFTWVDSRALYNGQGNQETFCGYVCNYRMGVESRGSGMKERGKERVEGYKEREREEM